MNRRGFIAIQVSIALLGVVFAYAFSPVAAVHAQSDEAGKVVIPSLKDTTALFDDIRFNGAIVSDFRNQTDGARCQLPYVELDDPDGVNIMLSSRIDFKKGGTFTDGRNDYSWPDQAPVVKFGLWPIPAGAKITKAQLRLEPTSPIVLSGRSQRAIDNNWSNIGSVMRVSDQSILDCRWSQKQFGTGFVGGNSVGAPQQFGTDGLREGSPFGGNPRLNLPAMSLRWITDMNLDVTSMVQAAKSEGNTVTFRVEPHKDLPIFLGTGVITNPLDLISSRADFWSREHRSINANKVPKLVIDYEFENQAEVSGGIRLASNNQPPTANSEISFWRSENNGDTWQQLTNETKRSDWGPYAYDAADASKTNVRYKTEIIPPGGFNVSRVEESAGCPIDTKGEDNRVIIWSGAGKKLPDSGCTGTIFYLEPVTVGVCTDSNNNSTGPLDIIMVVDASGSVGDRGPAERNALQDIRSKVRNYGRNHSDDRVTLFTYSYNNESGKKHRGPDSADVVLGDDAWSSALNGFDAPGSNPRDALREASELARAQYASTKHKQVIMYIGDVQQEGMSRANDSNDAGFFKLPQGVQDRLQADRQLGYIKYYTFALSGETGKLGVENFMSDSAFAKYIRRPYKEVARVSNGRFYLGDNIAQLDEHLDSDSQGSSEGVSGECSISGVKFDDTNGDGTQDDGESNLQNWAFNLYKFEAGRYVFKSRAVTNTSGEYSFAPSVFRRYGVGKYKVREAQVDGWTPTTPDQENVEFVFPDSGIVVGHDFGNKSDEDANKLVHISNMTKSLSIRELRGSQKNTTIRINFRVTYDQNGTSGSVKNVVLEEKLGNSQLSYQSENNKAKYRLVKIGGGNVSVESVASSGNTLRISKNASGQPIELTSGDYSWEIDVTYNGGATQGDGIDVDDLSGAVNTTECLANKKSRAEYDDSSDVKRCIEFGQAKLVKKTAKVILNSDAWIGDKDVQIDDSLQVGNNTLLISGRAITGRTGAGNELNVSNYRLPSTGKAVWKGIVEQMDQRIKRVNDTHTAKEITTCPSTVSKLNLSAPNNPFTEDTIGSSGSTIWRFKTGCNFDIPTNLTIIGTGTIINPSGGRMTIRGNIQANGSSTFGYIGTIDNGGACSGQTTNPAVSLGEGISIKNVAIFVGGACNNGTIRTGASISSTCSTTAPATIYEAKLISYVVEFPNTNRLCNDVLFNRSDAVAKNPPPLFDQFYVPQGRETP